MQVHIYALKRLQRLLTETADRGHMAALVSSSYGVEHSRMAGIQYAACRYDDIDRHVPGRSMTLQDAQRFASFVTELEPSVTELYCCCDGGCRRSAAVACGVMRWLGQDDLPVWSDPCYDPNVLVYTLVCQALSVPVSDEELDLRIETHHQAVKAALRR